MHACIHPSVHQRMKGSSNHPPTPTHTQRKQRQNQNPQFQEHTGLVRFSYNPYFSTEIVFLFHNKLVETIFRLIFSAKLMEPFPGFELYIRRGPGRARNSQQRNKASEETCRTDDGSHVYGYGDDVAAADRCQSKDYYIYTYIFS